MSEPFIPCFHRTLANVFGDESPLGRVPKLHIENLAKNFEGQPEWLIVFRLALATQDQLIELHEMGKVSAIRIRKRIAEEFRTEPRRDDETTLECFMRFFGRIVRVSMTARLLYEINLDNPLKQVDDVGNVRYIVIQAFNAIGRGELDLGEIATIGPERLTESLHNMFDHKVFEVGAYRVVTDTMPTIVALLKAWQLEFMMPPLAVAS
jgi:hypothetical protein